MKVRSKEGTGMLLERIPQTIEPYVLPVGVWQSAYTEASSGANLRTRFPNPFHLSIPHPHDH